MHKDAAQIDRGCCVHGCIAAIERGGGATHPSDRRPSHRPGTRAGERVVVLRGGDSCCAAPGLCATPRLPWCLLMRTRYGRGRRGVIAACRGREGSRTAGVKPPVRLLDEVGLPLPLVIWLMLASAVVLRRCEQGRTATGKLPIRYPDSPVNCVEAEGSTYSRTQTVRADLLSSPHAQLWPQALALARPARLPAMLGATACGARPPPLALPTSHWRNACTRESFIASIAWGEGSGFRVLGHLTLTARSHKSSPTCPMRTRQQGRGSFGGLPREVRAESAWQAAPRPQAPHAPLVAVAALYCLPPRGCARGSRAPLGAARYITYLRCQVNVHISLMLAVSGNRQPSPPRFGFAVYCRFRPPPPSPPGLQERQTAVIPFK